MNEYMLRYTAPASCWEEALPLGNGALGAMVFGRARQEIVRLNEETLWTGYPYDWDNPECREHLEEMRQAVFSEDYPLALQLVPAYQKCRERGSGMRKFGQPYGSLITAGDVVITDDNEGETILGRTLDLRTGVAVTELAHSTRTHFVSAKYGVAVTRIAAKGDTPLHLTVRYDSMGGGEGGSDDVASRLACKSGNTVEVTGTQSEKTDGVFPGVELEGDTMYYTEQFPGEGANAWACHHRLVSDGHLTPLPDGFAVTDATVVTVYTAVATSYRTEEQPLAVAAQRTQQAAAAEYTAMLAAHTAFIEEQMTRSVLSLDSDPTCQALPTDQRLSRLQAGEEDTGLFELYFNFGKYLLISSSSDVAMLPANLQGIWCKDNTPPWSSDYHININIQMNYWPAEVTGLAGCADAFFRYIRFLSEHGKRTAEVMYGCGGWVAHTITTPWGFTAAGENPFWGAFVTAGAWCCMHIVEHYRYTLDTAFLREYWDVLRGSAAFFLDFLVEDPRTGYMVTCPSNSPENRFLDPKTGVDVGICAGPTMDNQILRDIFSAVLNYAPLVGEEDEAFLHRVEELLTRLPQNRIGKNGTIMEWQEDYDEWEPGHRHVSHLYGLYPSHQITKEGTPDLFAAAEKTIERRLSHGGGHTGWSRAWIANFYARLRNGTRAGEELTQLLTKSTLPNLFDNHPPFQIDGNFGGCAAIAEMLVQNNGTEPVLLPALPPSWKNGSFSGFRVYGNRVVSCTWQDGQVVSYEITPAE